MRNIYIISPRIVIGKPDYMQVRCQHCRARIGEYKKLGDQIRLKVGPLELSHVVGECENCKKPYNFDATGKRLERLIERAKRREGGKRSKKQE